MHACKSTTYMGTLSQFCHYIVHTKDCLNIMLSQGLAIDSSFQTKKATKGVSSN